MTNTPLISVIVPVCNVANYLPRCLDSICNQTYKNLEIILVDDGSTDNSLEICKTYANKDKRIVVIQQQNAGVSAARNAGLEKATGELVSFVDADDWLDIQCYAQLIAIQQKTNAEIVWFNLFYVYENNPPRTKQYPSEYHRNLSLEDFFFLATRQGDFFCWNKLFSKKSIGKIRFNPALSFGEDRDFLIKIVFQAKSIFFTPDCLYYYSQNNNSLSRTLNISIRAQEWEILKKTYNRCKQESLTSVLEVMEEQITAACCVLIMLILLYDTTNQYPDLLHVLRQWLTAHKKIFSNSFMQVHGKCFAFAYQCCPCLVKVVLRAPFINSLLRKKLNNRLFAPIN